eukprot:g10195.t1
MALVLSILVILAAMALPLVLESFRENRLRDSTNEVYQELANTRLHAIDAGLAYQFRFEPGGRNYLIIPYERDADDSSASVGGTDAVSAKRPRVSRRLPAGFKFDVEDADNGASTELEVTKIHQELLDMVPDGAELRDIQWSPPILFFPDGSSQQASFIVVDDKQRYMRLSVRELTGAVSQMLLSMALVVVLIVAVYAALDVYRSMSSRGRDQVETSQLTRSIFQKMAVDIRSVTFTPPKQEAAADSGGEAADEDAATTEDEQSTTEPQEVTPTEATAAGSKGVIGNSTMLVLNISKPPRGLNYSSYLETDAAVSRTSDLMSVTYLLAGNSDANVAQLIASNTGRTGLARIAGDRLALDEADEAGNDQMLAAAGTVIAEEASVLFVVLVVIALLTLAAYQFSGVMTTEYVATNMYARRVQARAFADSGVEMVASQLANRQVMTSEDAADVNLFHNPRMFGGYQMTLTDASSPRGIGRFSVVSPMESDAESKTVRFGLADESGKLNINTLVNISGGGENGREKALLILLDIPGMTEDIADAILDWIDTDDETTAGISEEDLLGIPAKNGPFESLDEMLLLPGVTPNLLFGADANRNGIIDADEAENANGDNDFHPLGWSAFLTVHSRESNLRLADGEPRVNVNEALLTELYDGLEEEFADDASFDPEEVAKFIVAYRMNGPSNIEDESELAAQGLATPESSGRQGAVVGGTGTSQTLQKAALGTAKVIAGAAKSGGQVTRGGMDLSGGAKFSINSIYDLVDAEVEVEVDGSMQTLKSPFTSEGMTDYLPDLLDRLSTTGEESIEGRLNVNQVRKEVLAAVIKGIDGFSEDPELAESLASTIVAEKMVGDDGMPLSNVMAERQSTGWLVTNGHVTLAQMRQLDRYLTTRGDVYRAQVLGDNMAEFLALDWDNRNLCGFEAQVSKGSVRVRKAFALEWPAAMGSAAENKKQRGDFLGAELKRLKVGNHPVLICLPREAAVVRQLEVPDVPDHELPDLVRLQAETRMSTSIEQQLLDFLPLPKRDDSPTREVLLTTVSKESIAEIKQILEVAGLEAKSVGLSSAAMTEIVARAAEQRGFDPEETSLVLARHHRRLEISLVRGRNLLFTHSADLTGENDAQDVQLILAEVSRSFVSIERILRGESLARAWVIGSRELNASLCRALEDRLSYPVAPLEPVTDLQIQFDPSDVSGDEAHFAGPVGMLLSQSGSVADAVDFLNPRKAARRIDRKTMQMRIAAAAAAALILFAGIGAVTWNALLASELRDKRNQQNRLTAENNRAKPTLEAADAVKAWVRHDVHWPEQFRELNKALPGTDRIFMTNFTFVTSQKKKGEVAGIKATGYAIDRLDVSRLEQKLTNLGYIVFTKPTRPTQKDPKYRWRFDLELKIDESMNKRPTDTKKSKKKTSKTTSKKATSPKKS